jgi:hypothetical protein
MLKRLFTSKVRVKLLTLFLLNPEEDYFIRELTRKLDEQINSVRRELDNLKKMGLLTSKSKNRKKYYTVNKSFILYPDLKNIVTKASFAHEDLVSDIAKTGKIDLLVLSGVFLNKESECDILVVGEIDKEALLSLIEKKVDKMVKFTALEREDFIYRVKYNDRFISSLLNDPENIIPINKLEKYLIN